MKYILHHLKTEFILNYKVIIVGILLLFAYVATVAGDPSESNKLIDSANYIVLPFIFGFLFSSTYKRDFSFKYYAGLPIKRDILILMMIIGRLVYFVPGAIVLTVYYDKIPNDPMFNYNWVSFILTYFIFVCIFNATQVINDIEVPRVETVTSRLESLLIFLKRIAINYVFNGTIVISGFLLLRGLIELLGIEFLNNQFLIVIYGAAVFTFLLYRTHQILLNEILSYWSWKRDGSVLALLIVLVTIPSLIFKNKLETHHLISGDSPYFEAIEKVAIEDIKKLHAEGHSLDVKNEYHYTPLLAAIRKGDLKLVLTLEELGAKLMDNEIILNRNIITRERDGDFTPLHLAVLSNNPKMVDYVLSKSDFKELHKQPQIKLTPLQAAAFFCYPAMIEPLIETGANVNERTKDGQTPLMLAARDNCPGSIVALLMNGANADYKDLTGKTVFDYAKGRQVEYLLERFNSKKSTQNRLPASTNLANPQSKR